MSTRILSAGLFVFVLLVGAHVARADSYVYTGNILNNQGPNGPIPYPPGTHPCDCAITGLFTIAGAIAPNSAFDSSGGQVLGFSFTNGSFTLNQLNSNIVLSVSTGPNGEILLWSVDVTGNSGLEIFTVFYGSGIEATDAFIDASGEGYGQGNRGTWATVATPEPEAALLLASGMLCLPFVKRRRTRTNR